MNPDAGPQIPPEVLDALRRNSGIGLAPDGGFTLHGAPVANPRVQALFHRGLAVRPDGDVVLTVGARWCYVSCAGVARFVVSVRLTAAGLVARLEGGAVRTARHPIVGYGPDDRLYLWLTPEDPPALLLRAAHQDLLARVGDDMTIAIPAGGAIRVHTLTAVPGPSTPPPTAASAGDLLP